MNTQHWHLRCDIGSQPATGVAGLSGARPKPPFGRKATVWAALAALLLSGCATVGPDYSVPATPLPAKWDTALEEGLDPAPLSAEVLAAWWQVLDDPVLSALIQKAVAGNLDLRQARARVRQARARLGISAADKYPSVGSSGAATRSRGSENTGGSGSERDVYRAGFDAGWELDLFGGVRRGVEAAEADLEAGRQDLRDVLVSLLAETADTYIQVRALQARLAVAEQNLEVQEKTWQLTVWRKQAGLSDELAEQQARYNLESTRALIPTLTFGLTVAVNRMALLLGEMPGPVQAELSGRRSIPAVPERIAVGLPADTLRQRPDVRRAERQLAAQVARIGVATADLYPKLRLSGSIGLESLSAGDLLTAGSRTFSLGPSFSWNLFDAGAVRRNIGVQSALADQQVAAYVSAVLTAAQEAENALKGYAQERKRNRSLQTAAQAARQATVLADYQYRAGLIDFNRVLDAQRSLLSLQDSLVQSNAAEVTNLIALYKAMGGGWDAFPEVSE
jgi:NodT family efflux transporter outer membrane factor (OMF) lipoprotein